MKGAKASEYLPLQTSVLRSLLRNVVGCFLILITLVVVVVVVVVIVIVEGDPFI